MTQPDTPAEARLTTAEIKAITDGVASINRGYRRVADAAADQAYRRGRADERAAAEGLVAAAKAGLNFIPMGQPEYRILQAALTAWKERHASDSSTP